MNCKFCGTEIKNVPTFKHTKPTSCPDCNRYCNQKCEKHRTQMLSWHKEPCISCEHNPYRKAYKYEGEKWKKEGIANEKDLPIIGSKEVLKD